MGKTKNKKKIGKGRQKVGESSNDFLALVENRLYSFLKPILQKTIMLRGPFCELI